MKIKKINLFFPVAIITLMFTWTASAGAQAFTDDAENIPARTFGGPNFQLGDPLLEFDEQFHDFGQITKGEKPKHTFSFYNRGKAPLIIDMVSACECTHLDWTRSMIYPGKKGYIYVEYDSSDRDGEQEVTMDVIAYKMLPDQEEPREEDMILAQARFRVFVKQKE
ncbi:MAG: DUF1573 domain-containing protein [Bacteroidetes bacterium]|jgi:hypothetical protein|nr:DUF1573 domain-containing protein [Bacteroidota bacterium]